MNRTRIADELHEVMGNLRSRNPAIVAIGAAQWHVGASPTSRVWNWDGEIAGSDDRHREIAWVTEATRSDLEARELRIYRDITFRVVNFDPTHPFLDVQSASRYGAETRDLCVFTVDQFYDFRIDVVASVPNCTDLGRFGDRARRPWFAELLELKDSAMRAVDMEERTSPLASFEVSHRDMWRKFLWDCYEGTWGARAGA